MILPASPLAAGVVACSAVVEVGAGLAPLPVAVEGAALPQPVAARAAMAAAAVAASGSRVML